MKWDKENEGASYPRCPRLKVVTHIWLWIRFPLSYVSSVLLFSKVSEKYLITNLKSDGGCEFQEKIECENRMVWAPLLLHGGAHIPATWPLVSHLPSTYSRTPPHGHQLSSLTGEDKDPAESEALHAASTLTSCHQALENGKTMWRLDVPVRELYPLNVPHTRACVHVCAYVCECVGHCSNTGGA